MVVDGDQGAEYSEIGPAGVRPTTNNRGWPSALEAPPMQCLVHRALTKSLAVCRIHLA